MHLLLTMSHWSSKAQCLTTLAMLTIFQKTLGNRKKTLWRRAQLLLPSDEAIRIGAAAYSTPHIKTYQGPRLFCVLSSGALYFKMDVYHYLSCPAIWLRSSDLFLRATTVRDYLLIKCSNTENWQNPVCVISVTITNKMRVGKWSGMCLPPWLW